MDDYLKRLEDEEQWQWCCRMAELKQSKRYQKEMKKLKRYKHKLNMKFYATAFWVEFKMYLLGKYYK